MQSGPGSLGEGRLDVLWEALEAVHDRDGDVLDAAVVRGVETLGPDRCALIGLKPQAQDVPAPIWQDGRGAEPDRVRHLRISTRIAPMKTTG